MLLLLFLFYFVFLCVGQGECFSGDFRRGRTEARPTHGAAHVRNRQQALDELRLPPSGHQGVKRHFFSRHTGR